MFLASASTKRPIAMSCLLFALVVLGVNSYRKLSVENMPSVDVPYITVRTVWAGASAEDIEKDVAKTLEDAVSSVEGIKHLNSLCIPNACVTLLEFELDRDVDIAAQDVREKIDGVLSELPSEAEAPVIEKIDINAAAIATMFLGGTQTLDDLYEYADNVLADRFATIRGVGEVELVGGSKREVWIELDSEKSAAAGVTSAAVVSAVKSGILTIPGGNVKGAGREITVQFAADFDDIEAIGNLEISAANDRRVYLRDIATIRKASEEVRQRAFLGGEGGIIIKVIKKSNGNTVEIVRELRKRFEELAAQLPAGMEMHWVLDDGEIVQSTVDSTKKDIISSVILCAALLFAFLLNLRTTLIVSVTMPATIIVSLFFMRLCDLSLNTATLLAMGLSTGILVSNSIVVLENVVRRFGDFSNRWEAARVGTNEVAVAVLASAGTNVVVMFPIALMTSLPGRFFFPFALTTLIVNLSSIFISFTLTPILCALWMREKRRGDISSRWEEAIERRGRILGFWLYRIIKRRALAAGIIAAAIAIFFLSMKFGSRGLGFTLLENDDWGRVIIRCEYPAYYNLERTTRRVHEIAEKLEHYDDLESVLVSVGKIESSGGEMSEGVNLAQIVLVFKSVYERDWKLPQLISEIRAELAQFSDVIISARLPRSVGKDYSLEMVLTGEDLDAVSDWARGVQWAGMQHAGFASLDTTARDDKPELRVTPKRTVLADAGVAPSDLGIILRANIEGIEAASYKAGAKTIDIRVKNKEVGGWEEVAQTPLPNGRGGAVPLETFADVEHSLAKSAIYRVDKERTVKLLGNEAEGFSTQMLFKKLAEEAERTKPAADCNVRSAGMTEMLGDTIADFAEALILAALFCYLTLAAILESWRRPLLVLLTLPLALIGVVWALKAAGLNVSIFVLLGCMLLIGVVVNPAILIIDRMGELMRKGLTARVSVIRALSQTFRSVVMVIAASAFGMIPIALASGIGAVNRIGIGAASVGGILISGIFTLFLIPICAAIKSRRRE